MTSGEPHLIPFMQRCLHLAEQGRKLVGSNPMVGSVIVINETIIAEGAHRFFGGPHAEIEALNHIPKDRDLSDATLFVSLEPCSHFGKTPPCTEAIAARDIKRIVIASLDPFESASGRGVAQLRQLGAEVSHGVLEQEAISLNRRFFTRYLFQRPYVILKWAETQDHFIAKHDQSDRWISDLPSRELVHCWRTEEQAILVGARTALLDNPHLTARNQPQGPKTEQPIRILLDPELIVPTAHNLYNQAAATLIINDRLDGPVFAKLSPTSVSTYIKCPRGDNYLPRLLQMLALRGINSVIVEGGAKTLEMFLASDLWDEARVFQSPNRFYGGIKGPDFEELCSRSTTRSQSSSASGRDILKIVYNHWERELASRGRNSHWR